MEEATYRRDMEGVYLLGISQISKLRHYTRGGSRSWCLDEEINNP